MEMEIEKPKIERENPEEEKIEIPSKAEERAKEVIDEIAEKIKEKRSIEELEKVKEILFNRHLLLATQRKQLENKKDEILEMIENSLKMRGVSPDKKEEIYETEILDLEKKMEEHRKEARDIKREITELEKKLN